MKVPARVVAPDLQELLALFLSRHDLAEHRFVPAAKVPPPYHGLLVHEHHMTVTVEKFHGGLVNVSILDRRQNGDSYARKILLTLQKTGRVVQYGIMRIHLRYCNNEVQKRIVAGQTPLGIGRPGVGIAADGETRRARDLVEAGARNLRRRAVDEDRVGL